MWKAEFKYKIDDVHKTVVALGSFAGKTVVGVARCAPEDTFDVERGKKLAAARCAVKIAEKRLKWAEKCSMEAASKAEYWADRQAKMEKYETDAASALLTAAEDLVALSETFED